MCGSRKYPYPLHGGAWKLRGVGRSERGTCKFQKGRDCIMRFFKKKEGSKCDQNNVNYCTFLINSDNLEQNETFHPLK